jgi:hypothetical protein
VDLTFKLFKFDFSSKGLVSIAATEFFIGLVPIVVFLVTNNPHDCFMCLGKDPLTCTYSMWQTDRQTASDRASEL